MKGTAIDPLSLSGQLIEFVPHWKYLGTTFFTGNQLTFSSKPELSCFYCSFNSLLSCVRKPNELVLMNLLYANCVPSLTYASEVKDVTSCEMQEMNTALNDAIRRIFSYNRWESTRLLRQQLGFPNVTEIFQKRRDRFLTKCMESDNIIIRLIVTLAIDY